MTRERAGAILAEAGLPPEPPAAVYELPDFDLGALAAEGVKPPVMLAGRMLYASAVHCVAGPPGEGKTTLACWWMLRHLRDGGAVMLVDEESGPEIMVEKLLDMGASAAELRPPRFSYIPFPGRAWNSADIAQLRERIADRRPGIITFDSAIEFLTLADLDENSSKDTGRFWKRVFKPLARDDGAAVVVVDHTGKGDHGGYGRGSGGKKGASDVLYLVETLKPFGRDEDGILRLTVSPGKDRRGYLPKAQRIHVRAGDVLTLEVVPDDGSATAATLPDMPPARAKLLEALRATAGPDSPVIVTELVDWIAAKHGHGLKRPTCSTQLNALQEAGLADCLDEGQGKPKRWFPTRQQSDADGSDLQKHDFHDPRDEAGCQQGVSGQMRLPRSDPSAPGDASALTPPRTRLSASPPPIGGDADTSGGTPQWLARRDPAAPEVRPPCRHPECWDALAGRCLEAPWPAGTEGEESNR